MSWNVHRISKNSDVFFGFLGRDFRFVCLIVR